MIDAAKDYLTPKRFGIVAYVCIIVHFLCGLAFTVLTAILRAREDGKFSCFVDGQSTATYKKQVDQACFLRYDEAYNSPLPLYGFVLLSIGSTVLISVIYSLVAWKRVDEIESNYHKGQNDSVATDQTQNMRTIYVFYSYFVHLVLRALFGIIFTVLQHAYFYPNGFDSKFACNLRPTDDVTPNGMNTSKSGSRNSTSFTCQNATASEKMAWGITVSILNCLVAIIILVEVVYLLRGFSILKCHCEDGWKSDSEFVTVHLLGKQCDEPERRPLSSTINCCSYKAQELDAEFTDTAMDQSESSENSCIIHDPETERSEDSNVTGGDTESIINCEKESLRIGNMKQDVFTEVCDLLNIERGGGQDWKDLAGKLDYNVTKVKIFKSKSNTNPAGYMLNNWNNLDENNNLEKLVEAVRKINNYEVMKLLQDEITEKGKSCKCRKCKHKE